MGQIVNGESKPFKLAAEMFPRSGFGAELAGSPYEFANVLFRTMSFPCHMDRYCWRTYVKEFTAVLFRVKLGLEIIRMSNERIQAVSLKPKPDATRTRRDHSASESRLS